MGRFPDMLGFTWLDGHVFTAPVASFPTNAWGMFDVHGNVQEWCADVYAPYDQATVTDPVGPPAATGDPSPRVLRGGSFASLPAACRAAPRLRAGPGSRRRGSRPPHGREPSHTRRVGTRRRRRRCWRRRWRRCAPWSCQHSLRARHIRAARRTRRTADGLADGEGQGLERRLDAVVVVLPAQDVDVHRAPRRGGERLHEVAQVLRRDGADVFAAQTEVDAAEPAAREIDGSPGQAAAAASPPAPAASPATRPTSARPGGRRS